MDRLRARIELAARERPFRRAAKRQPSLAGELETAVKRRGLESALDKACVDLVYAADPEKSASLRERMESRHGIHTLNHAEALGLGSQTYDLISIDA